LRQGEQVFVVAEQSSEHGEPQLNAITHSFEFTVLPQFPSQTFPDLLTHASICSQVLLALQEAVDPPPTPAQVQLQGPGPVTAEGVPALQRVAGLDGLVLNVPLLAEPQVPLTTGSTVVKVRQRGVQLVGSCGSLPPPHVTSTPTRSYINHKSIRARKRTRNIYLSKIASRFSA